MIECTVVRTIATVPAARWDACVAGAIEDHAALLAIEEAKLAGFDLRYLLAGEGDRLLAAAPVFVAPYPLDTMMEGGLARVVRGASRILPSVFAPRLACIGSPCTETAGIGFAPDVPQGQRPVLADRLLTLLDTVAVEANCSLLGIKDLPDGEAASFRDGLAERGYHPAVGQPNAWLPIDFADLDGYFAMLSRATRRDLRRKLRAAAEVRIERRTRLADTAARVFDLYLETRSRAHQSYEELTPAYFSGILERMEDKAFCTLYSVGDDLLGANLLIEHNGTLLDKYWCMAQAGQRYSLYFLSWITNVRHCLDRGLTRYQAGQAAAGLKRSLGCRLERTTNFVRHRNRLCSRALGAALPFLAGEQEAA